MISHTTTNSSRQSAISQWTMESALEMLHASPHDPCIQYIALQLGRRNGKVEEVWQAIVKLAPELTRPQSQNLLQIFSGASAVHESLQLDAMNPSSPGLIHQMSSGVHRTQDRVRTSSAAHKGAADTPGQWPGRQSVFVSELDGPKAPSHPWREMLGERKPRLSVLSELIPSIFI